MDCQRHTKTSYITAALLALGIFSATICGCSAPRTAPRLACVIVVDSLQAKQLVRFQEHFSENGFKRIIDNGAWFTNAHYAYATTTTAPGHATIVTGALPSGHGIVGNQWYPAGSTEPTQSVSDAERNVIGMERSGMLVAGSPHHLLTQTIGDQLKRRHSQEAKVWSISLKDRAAVLMGGHHADGAIWWDRNTGEYVSSSYYFPQLPAWCQELNDNKYAQAFFDLTWNRALPEEAYSECDDDDVPYESGGSVLWTNTLPKRLSIGVPGPHPLYFNRLRISPIGNELVFEAARRAITNEALGADQTTDLLFVGLSSYDACSHIFGPDSHETLDMLIRTDQQLAKWLDFIDEHVGLDQTLIVLTSDHGAGPAPEYAQKQGRDAGRIDINDLFTNLNDRLNEEFGTPDDGSYYLITIDLPWVYLNESTITKNGVDVDTAARAVARAARSYSGIEAAMLASDVQRASSAARSPLEQAVARSIYKGRSGQVFIHMKPNWYLKGVCAGHGTAHPYDTHVPLIFMGEAFKKGRYDKRVDMRDLAPTLSAALGIKPPAGATGRKLREALR